jgi:hypothetical protein
MLRKSATLLLSIVLLGSAVAAQAVSTTYIPTFSDGKYRGCTRYDDGVPTVTFLKVGLLACVVAGFLSTENATLAPTAMSADMKKALQKLPLDDKARFAAMAAAARKELDAAAAGAASDGAEFNRAAASVDPAVLRTKLKTRLGK